MPNTLKRELTRGGLTLRVGDRVIQQVNDYTREIFNGDAGTIASIDLEEQEVAIQFAKRQVSYDYYTRKIKSFPNWLFTVLK